MICNLICVESLFYELFIINIKIRFGKEIPIFIIVIDPCFSILLSISNFEKNIFNS